MTAKRGAGFCYTPEETETVIRLYNSGKGAKEIGLLLRPMRSRKSVTVKLCTLRKEGRVGYVGFGARYVSRGQPRAPTDFVRPPRIKMRPMVTLPLSYFFENRPMSPLGDFRDGA